MTRLTWSAALIVLALIPGCTAAGQELQATHPREQAPSAARGHDLIEAFNCGACHTIPGVRTARGVEAAPLTWFSRRTFIAGQIPNTPDNLARWIQDPVAIEPRTAMPVVGATEAEARDMAAYLFTLR